MRIVKQSTVKQFTSENHHWVLALSCSCSGSGDVPSFIWIPPRMGIIRDLFEEIIGNVMLGVTFYFYF